MAKEREQSVNEFTLSLQPYKL